MGALGSAIYPSYFAPTYSLEISYGNQSFFQQMIASTEPDLFNTICKNFAAKKVMTFNLVPDSPSARSVFCHFNGVRSLKIEMLNSSEDQGPDLLQIYLSSQNSSLKILSTKQKIRNLISQFRSNPLSESPLAFNNDKGTQIIFYPNDVTAYSFHPNFNLFEHHYFETSSIPSHYTLNSSSDPTEIKNEMEETLVHAPDPTILSNFSLLPVKSFNLEISFRDKLFLNYLIFTIADDFEQETKENFKTKRIVELRSLDSSGKDCLIGCNFEKVSFCKITSHSPDEQIFNLFINSRLQITLSSQPEFPLTIQASMENIKNFIHTYQEQIDSPLPIAFDNQSGTIVMFHPTELVTYSIDPEQMSDGLLNTFEYVGNS